MKEQESFADRIRKKIADLGSTGIFWKPRSGVSIIRILPIPGQPVEEFAIPILTHNGLIVDGQKRQRTCLKSLGHKTCPADKVTTWLMAQEDKEYRKLGQNLQARGKWHFNMIDRNFPDEVKVFGMSRQRIQDILNIMTDEDYGNILHSKHGRDIKLEKTGEGFATRYKILGAKMKSSPIGLDNWKELIHTEAELVRPITEDEMIEYLQETFGSYLDLEEILGGFNAERKEVSKHLKKKVKRSHRSRNREGTSEEGEGDN